MPLKTKPNRTANVWYQKTDTIINDYPAYKGDNDRYVATVPLGASGKPCSVYSYLNITHQPSGKVVSFAVSIREVKQFTRAVMTLLGDHDDENKVIASFSRLTGLQKNFIRNFNGKYPEGL